MLEVYLWTQGPNLSGIGTFLVPLLTYVLLKTHIPLLELGGYSPQNDQFLKFRLNIKQVTFSDPQKRYLWSPGKMRLGMCFRHVCNICVECVCSLI